MYSLARRRQRLRGVVLTHHHPDHIGAADACAERYGVPILAHPRTAEALRGRIDVQQFVNDGDCLDLGTTPDGKGRWHLQALHTPGHAAGPSLLLGAALSFAVRRRHDFDAVVGTDSAAAGGRSGDVSRFAAALANIAGAAAACPRTVRPAPALPSSSNKH